jgi:choline dehydrogenase-like flavoprotein
MAVADPPERTEVCIIGAGAAGGIIAAELVRRGLRVAMLESGPRHELATRAEYARRFLRGENPWRTSLTGLDRYATGGSVAYRLEWNRARGVGGSTLHWEGYALRFHANDFRLRSLYGIADDWPISYQDLEPYYARAEVSLGVAGAPDDPWASPRSAGFPLPPFPFSYSDGVFAQAFSSLGIALHHYPQARNSVPYGGRAQCRACGTCHVCPTGAKATIDLTHIREAEATGRLQLVTDATALRLHVDESGQVTSVAYAGHDRRERRLVARIFVVAAGAIETVRLLLLSASERFPRGLANRSGVLGKYFMSHPAITVTGRLKAKVHPYRTGFSSAMSRQFAIDRMRARRGAFMLELLNSAGPTPNQIATSSGLWGEALRDHVREEFGHVLGIRISCEQLPDAANSISLDPELKDYFGNPAPRITYDVGSYERETLDEATGVARRILGATGAVDVESHPLWFLAHQIGTHRMGTDPRSSIVDSDLRAHDVSNLYLVGSGCFVTASSSPPTLTIAALAIRAAEHIAARLRRDATA